MKLNLAKIVPASVTRAAAKTVMKTKINSPTILFVAGTTGMVASTVLACRATLQLEEVLAHGEDKIHETQMLLDGTHPAKEVGTYEYTAVTQASDVKIIRIKTAVEVAKIYAPAAIIGILSIAALTKSHHIMRDRNAQLAAAFATVSEAMNEYRKRVADEFGEEKERELYHGVKMESTTETGKDGSIKKVNKKTAAGSSPYSRLMGPSNANFCKDPWMTLTFIRCQEKFANERLQAQGFLTLNDLYDALGFDRSPEGMVVGWVFDKFGNNELNGDNHIDLGVWDDKNLDKFHDFMVGNEGQILIDFNVDGNIHELLMKKKHLRKG